MLQLDSPGKGLTDETKFDGYTTSVPAGVSYNFHPCHQPLNILPLMVS